MYRVPSARKKRGKKMDGINLIPVLDAVFIFIFFLLSSTTFINLFEISSDKPIISNSKNVPKKPPLALTIRINTNSLEVLTGVPSRVHTKVSRNSDGQYDLNKLHEVAYELKSSRIDEKSAVIEPLIDIPYEELVKIIDAIRNIKNTDGPLFEKDQDGIDIELEYMFERVVFGNLLG